MGDDATVVRTSLAAGEDALQRVAFEEAVGHLRTALAGVNRMSSSIPICATGYWPHSVAP